MGFPLLALRRTAALRLRDTTLPNDYEDGTVHRKLLMRIEMWLLPNGTPAKTNTISKTLAIGGEILTAA
jgi:hypothetical protein